MIATEAKGRRINLTCRPAGLTLGKYIRNYYGLLSGNDELIESCREVSSSDCKNGEEASAIIIKSLWEKLRETHKLRVLK